MKKNFVLLGLILITIQNVYSQHKENLKPRIVVLTDVSTWETDDSESLVRLFAHADLFEIEGIIYTTGWSLEETKDEFIQLINDAIDAYDKDLPNLMKRSNQVGFKKNEDKQFINYWPSADYLRKQTVFGSKKRGVKQIGKDNVSDGSNLIIKLADEKDKRPLWILLWGGGNTLAQAIWQVKQERSEDELKSFLHKLPTYAITDQDRSYEKGTPFDISSHQWLRKEFEKDLLFLWDESAWKYQNGTGRENWNEYAEHIQNHGNLGTVYPKYKYGVEGDTPSFLYLIPNGLSNPLISNQVNWGGYFEWGLTADEKTYSYTNHKGKANEICTKYETYFYPATFNNFAARMDWAKYGKGNRNPVVIINGDKSLNSIQIQEKRGETVTIDAAKSYDLENNELSFKWWILSESGTYSKEIPITNNTNDKISIKIPSDLKDKNIHVICEVTDNGIPQLTSYRRIIISCMK